MIRFSLATFLLTYCADRDVGRGLRLRLSKLERAKRWAYERAAIKTEVSQAKETVDLLRMAHAITRLDTLDAEIEAAKKAESGNARRQNLNPGDQIHDTQSVLRWSGLTWATHEQCTCLYARRWRRRSK